MNRAAVLAAPGTITMEDREMPAIGDHDVLIEVLAVGVCGSDVHYFRHGAIGDFVVTAPLVLGHEASGRVIETGTDVERVRVGDRVAIEPGVPCGRCVSCRSGRYNLCPEVRFLATPPIDGAFARYLAMPEDFVHRVPDELSDTAAALVEPFSVGLWANRTAGTTIGSRVLVTGAGPVGLLVATAARLRGAGSIVLTDVAEQRLEVARELGFSTLPAGELAAWDVQPDVLIECSGSPVAIRDGIRSLAPAGTAVLVGMVPEPDVLVPISVIQGREIRVTGTFRYANVYPVAIELAAGPDVDLDRLVSHEYPLAETAAALNAAADDPAILKAIVRPQR